MFIRVKGKGKYRYLQLVENHREGGRTVQRVLCTLGREEEMKTNGSIGSLLRSLARFSPEVAPDRAGPATPTHPIPQQTWPPHPRDSQDWKQPRLPYADSGVSLLRQSPVFSDLEGGQLAELSALASERHLRAGQFLFFENDPVESWYVVASGMIKATKHSPSGKDIVLAVYGPGETLANVVLFVGKPHICSGQAVSDTRVLEIKKNDFVSFLHRNPEMSFRVLVRMLAMGGDRFRKSVVALSEIAAERAEDRLARTLAALCLEFGPTIPLAHREIAEMAGTATGTATRFLSRLRHGGIIQTYRGKVVLLRQGELRRLAQIPSPE
ncbi:MAG: Crp/Fnr family transcriptional regulator [Chloroflexi bacterium]|nr:Crp/Fnr family transcriptional regulator [Chloroflexota bacterium]